MDITNEDDFSNCQKQIADEIKAIGGSGNIGGAIKGKRIKM